jgi:hypothetical protein
MNCAKIISMNIGDNCSPVVKGYKPEAVIINFDDIDFDGVEYDENNPHVITALPLLSGKNAYKVKQRGAQPFNGSNGSMSQGTYQNEIARNISVVVPADATHTNAIGQPLAEGAVVVMILESKSKGADGMSSFRVIGLDGGLVATAETDDFNGDAGDNYVFTLTETSTTLAKFLHAGTYSATKTMVDGLVKKA